MLCEVCQFNNPKATVTAIILKDNKILVLKRNEEPFKERWDLPGGYMNLEEMPEEAMRRELKEELGLQEVSLDLVKIVPGYGYWKDKKFPILSHFYLVDTLTHSFVLNEENSAFRWIEIKDLKPDNLAWDSNQEFCKWLKEKFTVDFDSLKELVKQLDSTAVIKEYAYYRAVLNGHVVGILDDTKLIGMGWIFPRQTLLRKQAVIEDMVVDETYRGRGYGRAILQELLKWAKEQRCDMVELTTNPARVAANELYKSEGFVLHPTNHYLYIVDSKT